MSQPRVAVVFGSDSDWPVMEKCVEQLGSFDIPVHVEVMSAHRNPERVHEFASGAAAAGIEVIIAGAGMSAALAGTVAANTHLPVIGVPLAGGAMDGLDSLLSTAQMPPGVPVACVAIGSAGAKNAAVLAVQMMGLKDEALAKAVVAFKKQQAEGVSKKNTALQAKING